jgi:iron complex transport system ATP-binding protein
VAVVGPNGSGKSTLVKAISAALPLAGGQILLGRRPVNTISARERARQIAVLAQETAVEFDFSVAEVVLMGRLPHLPRFGGESPGDREAVLRALTLTGTLPFADRAVTELSGGERQRVMMARALAQEPSLFLLDEPTAHLDIAFQVELLDLVRRLNQEQGLTVVAVLHDLNLAAQYADRVLMLKEGALFADGPPRSVITERNVAAVYGSRVRVIAHPDDGSPHVILQSSNRGPVAAWAD